MVRILKVPKPLLHFGGGKVRTCVDIEKNVEKVVRKKKGVQDKTETHLSTWEEERKTARKGPKNPREEISLMKMNLGMKKRTSSTSLNRSSSIGIRLE